jgi:microcystin-dependent protein
MAYTPNLTFSTGENAGSAKVNQLLNNFLAIYPVGALVYMHQAPTTVETTLQSKWLQCNGVAVSRTTYAGLFALLSTAYGAGDGSTTFNLPDLRGRIPVAIASGGHVDVNTYGDNDGAALANRRLKHAHTFVNSSHVHTWNATLDTGGVHSHTYNATYATVANMSGGGSSGNELKSTQATQTSAAGGTNHTHTYTPSSMSTATAVTSVGTTGTLTDQPGYIAAGCWYMAYA